MAITNAGTLRRASRIPQPCAMGLICIDVTVLCIRSKFSRSKMMRKTRDVGMKRDVDIHVEGLDRSRKRGSKMKQLGGVYSR